MNSKIKPIEVLYFTYSILHHIDTLQPKRNRWLPFIAEKVAVNLSGVSLFFNQIHVNREDMCLYYVGVEY